MWYKGYNSLEQKNCLLSKKISFTLIKRRRWRLLSRLYRKA